MSLPPKRFDIKSIAVVGAGPCGLAAAKYLRAQNAFDSIVVFEQQPEVGGVWNYSPIPARPARVPQVSPFCPPDPPVWPGGPAAPPVFPSPMYESLHTNIPGPLMRYSDLAFPRDATIFPSREAVQDYLVEYAKEIRHLIRFSTRVSDIRLRVQEQKDQWDVDVVPTESNGDDNVQTATYDAVVVASGHYSTVFVPDVKNLRAFHDAHPGVISHAKSYRDPAPFAGKKVVVVGNAASGLDIAAQIGRVCKKPLLLSVRTPSPPAALAHAGAQEVPVIDEFLVAERAVRFCDGRIERDVDAVLYATGYLFAFPFFASFAPPLVSNGRQVHGLYKHLVHIDHPTLVFPGLPIKVVPFPLSESQAAVFARWWANLLPLPSAAEMRRWEAEEADKKAGAPFHVWDKGGDAEYINTTHDWIVQSGTPGKTPPKWDDELLWQRKTYAEAKLEFEKRGRTAKSLAELGFRYEAQDKNAKRRDASLEESVMRE